MRTFGAILIKHRFSVSVLVIAALTATACATSSDSTQPAAPTETRATTASPSTTGTSETPPPEVSATQPPTTTTKPPITTTTSFSTTVASDTQPPTTATALPATTLPPPLLDNIAVVTSNFSSCSLHKDGSVYCWGAYPNSDSGNRVISDDDIPSKQAGISKAIAITAGTHRKCVVHANGTISCWQGNSAPVEVANIADAIGVSAASEHTCAVHADGTVSCWGSDQFGQLGSGNTINSSVPAYVENLSAGIDNTIEVPYSYVPVKAKGIYDAIQVATGGRHSCALHADGSVSCWGSNGSGQLGDGTTDDSATPVKVTGITDAISVAVDHEYSCVIHADRGVSCWGSNLFGILGYYLRSDDYDFSISPVSLNRISTNPIRVPEVSGAMSLHTNSQFLCALRIDNTATCWGYDKYGVFNCLHDNFSMWLEGSIGRDDKYSVPDCRAETCPHSIHLEGLEANPENEGWPVCSTLPTELIYTRKITSMSTQVGFICVTHTDTTAFCWGYDIVIQNPEGSLFSGKSGRTYTDPNTNLAYIIASPV